eukprot:2274285-Ditylum_brightwellii.AAC.1
MMYQTKGALTLAILGLARVTAAKNVLFPALGTPTNATSATTFNVNINTFLSPAVGGNRVRLTPRPALPPALDPSPPVPPCATQIVGVVSDVTVPSVTSLVRGGAPSSSVLVCISICCCTRVPGGTLTNTS